jgi:Holliday junction resolvase RusA-like endonuclease
MPKSWSTKRRQKMEGQPHTQRPDIDNLCKSVLDALYMEDSHIHEISLKKVWARNGFILFEVGI